MARSSFTREMFVPTASIKVSDKHSDAVAYLYTSTRGQVAAALFVGKQTKPAWRYAFRTEAKRAESVAAAFTQRQNALARKTATRAEEAAKGSGLVVGDILSSSWGYEQTNVDFYEVIEAKGKMVTIRQIRGASDDNDGWTGRTVPQSGMFCGEPMRKLARNGWVRINSFSGAGKWNTDTVAGVPVGPSMFFSTYG